jgi:hypothetical protein
MVATPIFLQGADCILTAPSTGRSSAAARASRTSSATHKSRAILSAAARAAVAGIVL